MNKIPTHQEVIAYLNGEKVKHTPPHQIYYDIAIEIISKHQSVKPTWIYEDEPMCPSCSEIIDDGIEVCECGQRLDWSEW